MEKKMIFCAEKETFITRVLINKAIEAGISCEFVPDDVDQLNSKIDEMPLIALYMDDARAKEDVLQFLSDTHAEKGGQLILIGEQVDLNFVSSHIPAEMIFRTFSRPVDNSEYVKTISEFFEKVDAGDFKKSILIVDDDAQYLALVRQWLKESYKVALVNSGMQAIKYLGKNKVDLILLDHEMPVTSGPQVLEMLRSEPETRSIPVIFLTGKSDKDSVMSVVALRSEGYFLKSIGQDELLEKLKQFFVLHR